MLPKKISKIYFEKYDVISYKDKLRKSHLSHALLLSYVSETIIEFPAVSDEK